MKNLNQGTDGAEVDDLLQLSYLQRLARQKVAGMEVSCLHLLNINSSLFDCRAVSAAYQVYLGLTVKLLRANKGFQLH